MEQLEILLKKELIIAINQAKLLYGCNNDKFIHSIEKLGCINAIKKFIALGERTDAIEKLAENSNLEHSIEAVVVQSKFSKLFSDIEIDYFLDTLVDLGYFG